MRRGGNWEREIEIWGGRSGDSLLDVSSLHCCNLLFRTRISGEVLSCSVMLWERRRRDFRRGLGSKLELLWHSFFFLPPKNINSLGISLGKDSGVLLRTPQVQSVLLVEHYMLFIIWRCFGQCTRGTAGPKSKYQEKVAGTPSGLPCMALCKAFLTLAVERGSVCVIWQGDNIV